MEKLVFNFNCLRNNPESKPFRKSGFTLIELLITVTIFSIVILASLNLFTSAFKEQKKSTESAYLLSEASYVTEYIARSLRMAKKDTQSACIAQNHNFEIPLQSHIKFLNYNKECQEFFLENNVLKVRKDGVTQVLTPLNLSVESLRFQVIGESQDDSIQPRVIFTLLFKTTEIEPQELNIQTTISQRDLDVKY